MKDLLKKYYKLTDEQKENLPFLYMYHELLTRVKEFENVKIDNMYDEEILMQTIIKCWYSNTLDAGDIVEKLLTILNCQDITIKDFENLDIDELKELLVEDNPLNNSEIIGEFEYKGYYCVFCRSNETYLLVLNEGEHSDVLIFDSIKDIFIKTINKHILDKFLYGKSNKNDE